MTLADIPADESLVLTEQIARLFRASDCEPSCHCCYETIEVGEIFKLATNEGRDVMLCNKHNVKNLISQRRKDAFAKILL